MLVDAPPRAPSWCLLVDQYGAFIGRHSAHSALQISQFERRAVHGIEFLNQTYLSLKSTRPVPRATRISAEDYASATVAVLQALSRLDLVRP